MNKTIKMSKQEFIDRTVLSGYASRSIAEEYANKRVSVSKEEFSEEDLVNVHRINERRAVSIEDREKAGKFYQGGGFFSTVQYD